MNAESASIARLGFSVLFNLSYFRMCNFVSGNESRLALFLETNLHAKFNIQKCYTSTSTCRDVGNPYRTIIIYQWYSSTVVHKNHDDTIIIDGPYVLKIQANYLTMDSNIYVLLVLPCWCMCHTIITKFSTKFSTPEDSAVRILIPGYSSTLLNLVQLYT